jgi:hypothetical protein
MNKLKSVLAVSALACTATMMPVAAQADDDPNKVVQWCVEFYDDGKFYAHLAEDYATWQVMFGHRVATFVAAGQQCDNVPNSFVFTGPNPWSAPEEPCEPAEPTVVTVVKEVEVIRYVPVEVSSTELTATVNRQANKIVRLKAQIRKLRNR